MSNSAFGVAGTQSGGTGSVTSVAAASTNTAALTITGSPIVNSGTLNFTSVGNFLGYQIFTSSGTWTKPAGVNTVIVEVLGGGGAGGGVVFVVSPSGGAIGGGGGSGGYARKLIDVSAIVSEVVTIGAGGVGSVGGTGGTGGTSSFGALITCAGGTGGLFGTTNNPSQSIDAGNGGVATGGDININGGNGVWGHIVLGNFNPASGAGADTMYSPAAVNDYFTSGGGSFGGNGAAATGYGGGGGGAGGTQTNPGSFAGGNGAPGIVIVYQYA